MEGPQLARVERTVGLGDDLAHRRTHIALVPRPVEERLVRRRIEERRLGQAGIIASRLNRSASGDEDRTNPDRREPRWRP
jgi:hypothetical protein